MEQAPRGYAASGSWTSAPKRGYHFSKDARSSPFKTWVRARFEAETSASIRSGVPAETVEQWCPLGDAVITRGTRPRDCHSGRK